MRNRQKYIIKIRWGKVAISAQKENGELREFRRLLHGGYRSIKFGRECTMMGKINIRQNNAIGVKER